MLDLKSPEWAKLAASSARESTGQLTAELLSQLWEGNWDDNAWVWGRNA